MQQGRAFRTRGPNHENGSIGPDSSYQGWERLNARVSRNRPCRYFSVIPPYPPVLALTPEVASPPLVAMEAPKVIRTADHLRSTDYFKPLPLMVLSSSGNFLLIRSA